MKVPYFNGSNYANIMSSPFGGDSEWIELKDTLSVMSDEFISSYSNLDSRKLVNFFSQNDYSSKTIELGGKQQNAQSVITFLKLLMPTLRGSNYFTWDIGKGGHHGIDIILPKSTPLSAFLDGTVFRIKTRDGKTKNEGNCVVIKSTLNGEDIFLCYEHLDKINVALNDKVNAGQTIGLCGTTGNSTQFHLHFQVDNASSPFHPYRSANPQDLVKYTYDPIKILRQILGVSQSEIKTQSTQTTTDTTKTTTIQDAPTLNNTTQTSQTASSSSSQASSTSQQTSSTAKNDDGTDLINQIMDKIESSNAIFTDMPSNALYSASITNLYNKGIIKGSNGRIFPDANIKRYEFALLIQRMITKIGLDLKIVNNNEINYTDIDTSDTELVSALKILYKLGVMKGSGTNFFPDKNLKGEEVLAVLGRMIYGLSDAEGNAWYSNYFYKFVDEGIISSSWGFINKEVDRKETFLLIDSILQKKSKI